MDALNTLLESKNLLNQLKIEQEQQFQTLMQKVEAESHVKIQALQQEVDSLRNFRLIEQQHLEELFSSLTSLAKKLLKQRDEIEIRLTQIDENIMNFESNLDMKALSYIILLKQEAEKVASIINGQFQKALTDGLENAAGVEKRMNQALAEPKKMLNEVNQSLLHYQELSNNMFYALERLEKLAKAS